MRHRHRRRRRHDPAPAHTGLLTRADRRAGEGRTSPPVRFDWAPSGFPHAGAILRHHDRPAMAEAGMDLPAASAVCTYPRGDMIRRPGSLLVAIAALLALSAATGAPASVAGSSGPTKGACAGAWNRSAPQSVLAWERKHRVWQATVQESIAVSSGFSWSTGHRPTATPQEQTPTCVIVLFAPHGGGTVVMGAWQQGTVPTWAPHPKGLGTGGSGNACVAHDGTIHRVGAFTASSRCPPTA